MSKHIPESVGKRVFVSSDEPKDASYQLRFSLMILPDVQPTHAQTVAGAHRARKGSQADGSVAIWVVSFPPRLLLPHLSY